MSVQHETYALQEAYRMLAQEVDDDTRFASGNFGSWSLSYQYLTEMGAKAVPYLVEDLREEMSWWRVHLVCELAVSSMGQCVYFPPEIQGRMEPVRQRVINWWCAISELVYPRNCGKVGGVRSDLPHFLRILRQKGVASG
jgi:hypothetical protein